MGVKLDSNEGEAYLNEMVVAEEWGGSAASDGGILVADPVILTFCQRMFLEPWTAKLKASRGGWGNVRASVGCI